MLKGIGFVDAAGAPSDYWRNYRGNRAKVVLAHALRDGYRALFEVYPDAPRRSDSELESFFSTRSSAGQQAISKTVSTFKNLSALADFADGSLPPDHSASKTVGYTDHPENGSVRMNGQGKLVHQRAAGPDLHLDIQIHISSDATAQQIDQIFASMAKHLYQKADVTRSLQSGC